MMNFAATGIQTHDLPTRIFFIAAITFFTGFPASSCVPYTARLVASTMGDLVTAAIASDSATSYQTHSLHIQYKSSRLSA